MLKKLIAMAVLSVATQANADMIFGPGDTIMSSTPGHDIISCRKLTNDNTCYVTGGPNLSPSQYAGKAGYTKLHSVGVHIQSEGNSGTEYIIMEVSR